MKTLALILPLLAAAACDQPHGQDVPMPVQPSLTCQDVRSSGADSVRVVNFNKAGASVGETLYFVATFHCVKNCDQSGCAKDPVRIDYRYAWDKVQSCWIPDPDGMKFITLPCDSTGDIIP